MEILSKYFTDFTDKQVSQFSQLQSLYSEWNEKINVISRKDIDSLYERHVLHSLSIAAVFDFTPGMEIIDLGTGGGFPGVPLAIFFPEVTFHLVDSIAKKLKVVEAVAEATGLRNITTQHSRIEDIRDRQANFVVSRAVAPLKDLWRWSKPLLKKSHVKSPVPDTNEEQSVIFPPGLICLKGGDLAVEIQQSETRPSLFPIRELFPEEFFNDKFIVYAVRR